jgi:hypothetical protein
MSCFSFSLFSSTKLENRRAEQVISRGRVRISGSGEMVWKGGKRVNMV